MGGERERLNQRISELTEQLSSAKTTIHSLETINVGACRQENKTKTSQRGMDEVLWADLRMSSVADFFELFQPPSVK